MSVDSDFFWMHPFIYMRGMWEEFRGKNRKYSDLLREDVYMLGQLKMREMRGWK